MEESRKRVIGIMAAILASLHMQTTDDLFGGPQGSPRTDRLIEASNPMGRADHAENRQSIPVSVWEGLKTITDAIALAARIMGKIDDW